MEVVVLQNEAGVVYRDDRHYTKFYSTNFEVGDVVSTAYNYSDIQRGTDIVVSAYKAGTSYDVTGRMQDGTYVYGYPQMLNFHGYGSKAKDARKFTLVRKANAVAAIGVNRATLVQQIKETTVTGVYDAIGEIKNFDSMGDAQLFCKKNIQDAIRARNEYPMYRVYEEKFIAQAKEPPVVFE